MPNEITFKCHIDCVFWLVLYFQTFLQFWIIVGPDTKYLRIEPSDSSSEIIFGHFKHLFQNLTSTQELLSPTTSPTTSSTASSSQSSPLSESEKHQQYSNSHSGGLYSPTAYQDSLGTVSSYDVSSKHQKSFPLPVSSLNNTQSCHSTVSKRWYLLDINIRHRKIHFRIDWVQNMHLE